MANKSESLINVVSMNRLKLLKSLNQKVWSWIALVNAEGHTDTNAPGEKAEPNLSALVEWNVVSPYIPVADGKRTVRIADGCAGMDDGKSKSPAAMVGIGTFMSRPKGSRLPSGLSLQENGQNF
jgi:hypothetical protein